MIDSTDPLQMTSRQVRDSCPLDDACLKIMHKAVLDYGLTAKQHDDILRLAKKAAMLAECESITARFLQVAIEHHHNEVADTEQDRG